MEQNIKTNEKRVEIPIYVAAISPFINIVFDEEDNFKCTLDEVNTGTYDYLKLCRTTMRIDGDVPEMKNINAAVIFSYSGALLFPTMQGISKQVVIDSVNRIIFKLFFGGIYFNSIAPEDIGYGILYGTGYFRASGNAQGTNYQFLFQLQQKAASNLETIKLLSPRTYTKQQINEALQIGSTVLKKLPEINTSLFMDGITHYQKFQLPSALVFIWATIEILINKIWLEKVQSSGTGIEGRKKFIESNAWHAAHKVEVLFQIGVVNKTLYGKLNKVRSARNIFAHKGQNPKLEVCEDGIDTLFSLVSLIVTDYTLTDTYVDLVKQILITHKPFKGELQPQYWREISSVPGDTKWGEQKFPRYPEIELIPLNHD